MEDEIAEEIIEKTGADIFLNHCGGFNMWRGLKHTAPWLSATRRLLEGLKDAQRQRTDGEISQPIGFIE